MFPAPPKPSRLAGRHYALAHGASSSALASIRALRESRLKWAQSSFMQPQMMVHDRFSYDPLTHKYTVDRYLDDLDKRYGVSVRSLSGPPTPTGH